MKKKLLLDIMLSGILFICSGCDNEMKKIPEEEPSTVSLAERGLDSKPEEGAEIIYNPEAFIAPKENQEYQAEFDDQYWLSMSHLPNSSSAETENCCYLLFSPFLYTYDIKTNQAALLCSDPTCSHTYNSDCNALITYSTASFLEYYNGYLYTLVVDQATESGIPKQTLNLYRISLDGTTKDFVAKVASAVPVTGSEYNTYNVYTAVIHRGYLYYMYGYGFGEGENNYYVNKSHVLYRIALDNPGTPEPICAMNYGGVSFGIQLEGHGSYLYFIQTGEENHMYRYNTESDQLEYMNIKDPAFYVVYGYLIIYYKLSDPDKYFYYNPKTQEQGIFYKAENNYMLGYLIWDKTYFNRLLINEDTRYMTICDNNFNEITRYEYNSDNCLYPYCFQKFNLMASDEEQEWYLFDKTDITEKITSMQSVKMENFR